MLPPARMSYATLYVQAACYLPVLTCHPWPQLGHIREAEWALLQLLCHFVLPWSAFICPLGVPSCSSRIPYWCSSVFSRYSPITLLTVIFCVNLMSRCLVKHDSACVWEGEGVVRLIPEWVDSVKQCVFPNMDQPHMILWRREWKSNSPGRGSTCGLTAFRRTSNSAGNFLILKPAVLCTGTTDPELGLLVADLGTWPHAWGGQKKALDPVELELQVVVPYGCWDMNAGPLEGQQMLLVTELSVCPVSSFWFLYVFSAKLGFVLWAKVFYLLGLKS